MKNYYEILEVNPKASKEVIKKAYQVLVKKYHPDLYTGEERIDAEQRVKDINEAYKILSDEFLREQYDVEFEKENQYNRFYTNSRNMKKEDPIEEEENIANKDQEKEKVREKNHKVGTFMSLVDLVRELFKSGRNIKNIKNVKREDLIAAGLTVIIVVILGIILWFIPATNGFMRSLIPFI